MAAKRIVRALFLLIGLGVLVWAVPASPADVEKLPDPVFEVSVATESGAPAEFVEPGRDFLVNVRFTLAMSDVKSYPVTVTIIMNEGGRDARTVEIFNGRLEEGIYVATERVRVEPSWSPQVTVKAIVKARVFNRSGGGSDSFYAYYTAEGTLRVGYR